jgi:hypothetical protein
MRNELIPDEATIYNWIAEVFAQGVRRPGYPADRGAEERSLEHFRACGLENVRAEPVTLPYWEPKRASLSVRSNDGDSTEIQCFPLPHSAPTSGLELQLVEYRDEDPSAVRDKISLFDVRLGRFPFEVMSQRATWTFDPDGTFDGKAQVLPFGRGAQAVMEPSIAAGAAGFIGTLTDYPSDSYKYYVPYDAIERPIPGVWISGSDGARLRELLARDQVTARIVIESDRREIECHNIVGELRGADDETVIIGSHHDGPWASAVEDGSGIALVFAQAAYWSRVPQPERPHRLVFLLNAGHMTGGAGVHSFIERHRDELARVVLEIHLEHTANECVEGPDGALVATGEPEARWWFTTRQPALEDDVRNTLEAEDLRRSFILPPDMFGPHPTTDGGPFHAAGVPLVNFLTAPFYLFDEQDTMDKIHRSSLVECNEPALVPNDNELIGGAFRAPDLALAAEELPDVARAARQREGLELLGGRIEADDRIRSEVRQPDDVAFVDIDGVRLRRAAGQPPLLPRAIGGIAHSDLTRVPLGDPEPAG